MKLRASLESLDPKSQGGLDKIEVGRFAPKNLKPASSAKKQFSKNGFMRINDESSATKSTH